MQLRRYEDSDHPAVVALHRSALDDAGGYVPGPWDGDFDDLRATYLDPGGEFLVGELDGRIVAMGALRLLGEGVAEIKRMRVEPGLQRRGYGAALLDRLIESARGAGLAKLTLDTTVDQYAAQRLYESRGFTRVGTAKFADFELLLYEMSLR